MDLPVVFEKLGIALGLGLLVGLQREYSISQLAGIRTFPVITVFGAVCALLAHDYGGWIVGAGAVAVTALVITGNIAKMREGDNDPGLTTEVAMLLMYAVGAYLVVGPALAAVAIGGGLAVLLQLKEPLHLLVRKIGPADIKAIMQFVLISLVILPVLPDENFGPFDAFNPFKSWLMVVLIVAISLGGYLAYKLLGEKTGSLLGGILGGLISSTATTVSYARRARQTPSTTPLAAAVILIASTIVFARVIGEVAVVAPKNVAAIAPPLAVLGGVMLVLALAAYVRGRHVQAEIPPPKNPAELKSALIFGAFYAVVKIAIAAAKDYYGPNGIYAVAILSGLHDMDAITLSTAGYVEQGSVDAATGWRVIMVAGLANLVAKAIIAAALGTRRLFLIVAALFATAFAVGVALIMLWPA